MLLGNDIQHGNIIISRNCISVTNINGKNTAALKPVHVCKQEQRRTMFTGIYLAPALGYLHSLVYQTKQ